jgi:hypothetical protein
MPILGVIASSTRQGQATDTGAMFALGSIIVPSGGTSLITFSSIPATYKHLQIRIMSRDARSATLNNLQMQINGTTGTPTYTYHSIIANAGAASVTADGGAGGGATDYIYEPSASASANVFGTSVFDILDYTSTVKNKTIRMIGGYDDNSIGRVNFTSSLWVSTDAVTSLYFRNSSNTNFVQYSSFSLYGIK